MPLKIACFLVSMFVTILTYGLDYVWTDKRKQGFKLVRKLMVVVVIASTVFGIISICVDERVHQRESQALRRRIDSIHRQNEQMAKGAGKNAAYQRARLTSLLKETRELKLHLDPFMKLAKQRYPSETGEVALKRLATDLNHLTQRTTALEVATRARQLSESDKRVAVEALRKVKHAQATIMVPLGDQEAYQLAHDVKECMVKAEWQVEDIQCAVFSAPAKGVEVGQNRESVTAALDAVIRVMKLAGTVPRAFFDPEIPADTIRIVIGTKES